MFVIKWCHVSSLKTLLEIYIFNFNKTSVLFNYKTLIYNDVTGDKYEDVTGDKYDDVTGGKYEDVTGDKYFTSA